MDKRARNLARLCISFRLSILSLLTNEKLFPAHVFFYGEFGIGDCLLGVPATVG